MFYTAGVSYRTPNAERTLQNAELLRSLVSRAWKLRMNQVSSLSLMTLNGTRFIQFLNPKLRAIRRSAFCKIPLQTTILTGQRVLLT